MVPVAVLAKSSSNLQKEVKVLAGIAALKMSPSTIGSFRINIDGQEQQIQLQPGMFKQIKHNSQVVFEARRYADNVILVSFPLESLWVLYDGERIEISAPHFNFLIY